MGVWVLRAFERRTGELHREFDLPGLTVTAARELVGADRDDPVIGVYDVPVDVVPTLVDLVDFDRTGFDWQLREYATTPDEWRDGGFLPPRFPPAFLDARPVRAKTRIDDH